MEGLTINEAASTTGWSARMLRYIEDAGLVAPPRTPAGYRVYGAAELQRLRTLRQMLERFAIGLTDVGFAQRLRTDEALRASVDAWLTAEPARPSDVQAADWLAWEQAKHQRLLAPLSHNPNPDDATELS